MKSKKSKSSVIISHCINYMSCVLFLLSTSYVMYRSIDKYLWERQLYALISFSTMFIFAVVMFFKENIQSKSTILYDIIDNLDTIVRLVGMPFFTTQVLIGLDIHPKGNYVPAIIGGCFGLYEVLLSDDLPDANSYVVYTSALTLATASYAKQKMYCGIAGLVFALGEYCANNEIRPFKMMPYAFLNYFLAAFTIVAYRGLAQVDPQGGGDDVPFEWI